MSIPRLNFNFINEYTKDLKLAILDKYTKYANIQDNIVYISKKYQLNSDFLTQLYFATQELDFIDTTNEILKVLSLKRLSTKR